MEVDGLDSVCAGLGCVSQDPGLSYVKSEHCLENLKNLQRFLRRDHPTSRPVFKQLGRWNTVGRDLVPIISQYRDDPQLIINAVKVVVFLTMPVDALSENISQQLDYLLDFKASFLHNDAVAVIMTLLEEPLEHLESHSFLEDDWKVVQLVLTLMRNLLDIQDLAFQKVAVQEASRVLSIRDSLLEHLFEENVMDLFLALAQHISGHTGLLRQDNVLFLEIFHHIFWGQSPEKLAKANGSKPRDKRPKQPSGQLRVITEEEQEQLKDLRLKDLSRHSRFSGSFVQLAEDGSRRMLKRNPFQSPIDSVMRGPQVKHGPVKRIACDRSLLTSEGRVLELLGTFADQVLLGSYNVVMQSVKDDISRERNWIQTADVALFFEVAKFFTAYQRCRFNTRKVERKEDPTPMPEPDTDCLFRGHLCGPIASTMDQDMFSMVVARWHAFSEAAKETNDWTSLSVTGSLFKEMVRMLDLVLKDAKDKDGSEQQEARVTRILLYKIFYDQTEQGTFRFLLHLLKSFDIHKQPRSHLADLVETVHVVLRTIEFLTEEEGALRVLRKGRKPNKRKIKSEDTDNVPNQLENVGALELNVVNCNAKVIADNDLPGDSDFSITVAKPGPTSTTIEAVDTASQDSVRELERENTERRPVEELEVIFEDKEMDEIHRPSVSEKHIQATTEPDRESEDESGGAKLNVEVSLNVQRCAAMFADNTVICNYCWLLRFFTINTAAINHYIICMLQRICKDHSLEPMLYQLSLFQIFYEILSNRKASKVEEHQRIFSFLTKLTRNFFKKLKAQPLLFLDVLFWKTRQECHLITTDYKIHSFRKSCGKSGKSFNRTSIADALGNDEADTDPYASQVGQSEHGLETSKLESTTKRSNGVPKTERGRNCGKFTETQEAQLMKLFEKYKDNPKCCHLLAQEIDPEGTVTAAHVRRRLKALNLSPTLQRCRIRKEVECQNASNHGRKPKSSKRSKQKKERHIGTGVDGESSDDETLSQLMEKVRGSTGVLSGGRKKRGNSAMGELKKIPSDDDNETLHDHLTMRRKAQRRELITCVNSSSPGLTETESGEMEVDDNREILSEKKIILREDDFVEAVHAAHEPSKDDVGSEDVGSEDVDQSLEDNVEEVISGGSASPLSSSRLGLASAGKRRRTLFTVDDDDDFEEI